MDDEAGGDTCAIGAAARRIEANIIYLRANGEMRKQADIHATAEAISKLAIRAATITNGDAGTSHKALHERRDVTWIMQREARAEEIRVRIDRRTGRGGVIAADVGNDTKPVIRVVGDRAAEAILIESARATETEIGVADAGVGSRLSARGSGEAKQASG